MAMSTTSLYCGVMTTNQYLIVRSTHADVGDVHDLIAAQDDVEYQGAYLVAPDATVTAVGVEQYSEDEYEIVGGEDDSVVEYVLYPSGDEDAS